MGEAERQRRDKAQALYDQAISDPILEAAIITASFNLLASSASVRDDPETELASDLERYNRLAKEALTSFTRGDRRRKYDA